MTKKLENLELDELLGMFNTTDKTAAQGKCSFVKKVETLPVNVQEAINIACQNQDVTNRDILAFINSKTDVKVNQSMIQHHRHKDGCMTCLYGTVTS